MAETETNAFPRHWHAAAVLLGLLLALAEPGRTQELTIRHWLVKGPLVAENDSGRIQRDYLHAEETALPNLGEPGWVEVEAGRFGRLDLNQVFAGQGTAWTAAYAHIYVFSPEDRTVLLVADSDDDLVAFLNGQRVWLNVVARGLGAGRDTVGVRLARGWNSLLLKALNRTGGFGLLARLGPAEPHGLDGLLLSTLKPPGLVAHNHPAPTVTVGPVRMPPSLSWRGGELLAAARIALTAWGADPFLDVEARLIQAGSRVASAELSSLSPGEPVELELELSFARLRRAALAREPLAASVSWRGGAWDGPAFVDPDRLLRLLGGRIEIGGLEFDSAAGTTARLKAALVVPPAFDDRTLDLLALGLGRAARYRVNGREERWRDGRVELCAPCRAGDSLRVEVVREPGRPLWMAPMVRVREIGYAEYADGYGYAKALAGRPPEIERPDPVVWLRAWGERGADGYRALLERYERAYAPLAQRIRGDTLHIVGNSHIDAAWLWPWSETIDVIRNTWRTSLKLAQIFPGYIFAASSAAYYDAMDRLEPGLSDSLAAAVERGYWVPVGGWWVESDLNLPAGESLVRQGLYGQRYFERRFGRRSRVAWTPDSFGYPWTVPQILKQSGFDYFVTQKIRWNDSTEFPYNAFYWQGRDGTRILTYNPYGYVHDLDPQALVTQRLEDRERSGTNHQLVLYGVGDHGGGPTIAMLRRAEDLRRIPTFPVLLYDSPLGALEKVESSAGLARLPSWDDELYLEYHRGTYTTQAHIKWRNRRSEVKLKTAEALAAIAGGTYPRAALERAWRLVLFNQFHDILPGSGIREIYDDAEAFYDSAWAMIDSVIATSFADLRARMDTRGRGRALVVFNPLGWARSGVVELAGGGARSGDTLGHPSRTPAAEMTSRRTRGGDAVRVAVTDVPAFGARVVHLPRDTMSRAVRRLPAPGAGPDWIENAYLRVELDTLSGEITRLYDKANRREALAPGRRGNVLQIFDDRPEQWDAWNIDITGERWEVTDVADIGYASDPWQAELWVDRRWGGSTFRQRLVLARDARYLDVRNEVDWHERRKALKVAFALNVRADSATYEIPYGTIGRSGRPRTKAERAKFEVSGQRWADVSQPDYGVSILNDGKYGWDYRGDVLRLTLLRSPVWPDSTADRGTHRFGYAVYPHAGDWRAAGTVRRAAEYNTPLLAAYGPGHAGPLGKSVAFASAGPENVELAWLKRAEESDAWVLRLVEWYGVPARAEVRVRCRVAGARRANLLEDPGDRVEATGERVRLSVRPYEIATLLVECER